MKLCMVLLFALLTAGCGASSNQHYVGGHWQPVVASDSLYSDDPCQDSLFVALQNKPYANLTAFEQAYFTQKWQECNGSPSTSHGSTPEWILAVFQIIAVVVGIISIASR